MDAQRVDQHRKPKKREDDIDHAMIQMCAHDVVGTIIVFFMARRRRELVLHSPDANTPFHR
jgi:hypothetical protein